MSQTWFPEVAKMTPSLLIVMACVAGSDTPGFEKNWMIGEAPFTPRMRYIPAQLVTYRSFAEPASPSGHGMSVGVAATRSVAPAASISRTSLAVRETAYSRVPTYASPPSVLVWSVPPVSNAIPWAPVTVA
jgi:hypothetical protein